MSAETDTDHPFRPPPNGAPVGKDWSKDDECSHRFIGIDHIGRKHIHFCGQPMSAHAEGGLRIAPKANPEAGE